MLESSSSASPGTRARRVPYHLYHLCASIPILPALAAELMLRTHGANRVFLDYLTACLHIRGWDSQDPKLALWGWPVLRAQGRHLQAAETYPTKCPAAGGDLALASQAAGCLPGRNWAGLNNFHLMTGTLGFPLKMILELGYPNCEMVGNGVDPVGRR